MDESPKLIPKLIHQTYKSSDVPKSVRPFMQSWRRLNEDWEIRFYDDEACFNFVKREFPEYYDAYRALPKHVERSDFFRWGPYRGCKLYYDTAVVVGGAVTPPTRGAWAGRV